MEYGQVLLWLVMLFGLSILGLPLTTTLFARLPGRGAGFAPTVALGTVSLVAYWVGHIRFGPTALVLGLLVLALGTGVVLWRGVKIEWFAFGEAMTIFAIAFGFQVAVRAVDPGIIFFIEDFLDYGMIRAVLRAETLPPEDFWYAGTRVRYHYGGHLVAALETMLTGTRPSIAYNLALAGIYAMLLAGTYELAGAIAVAGGRSRRIAGVLGVYFVGFAGNLLAPVVIIVQALPNPVRPVVAETIANQLHENAATPVLGGLDEFEYWDVLQMIPHTLTPHPLFAWFHGEYHAHMTSTPFLLLVVAMCYAYYRTPESNMRERRILLFLALPLAAGFSVLTDVLSGPTAMGMIWLALVFAPASPSTLIPNRITELLSLPRVDSSNQLWDELRRIIVAGGFTAAVSLLVIVVSAPFVLGIRGGEESLALLSGTKRSGIIALLLIHGPFLAVFTPYVVAKFRPSLGEISSKTRAAGSVFGVTLSVLVLVYHAPAIVLFVPLLLVGWYLLRTDGPSYQTLLIVAGAGLALLVEFIYVTNQEYVVDGRGNTVFRAYMHAWIFWGIAAGVILPRIVRLRNITGRRLPRRQTIRTTFVLVLVLSTSVYGGLVTFSHFDRAFKEPPEPWEQAEYVYFSTQMQDRPHPPTNPPTIEGLLYNEVNFPNETRAIEWFDRNVEGTPTMVTAPGGRWEWRSPAATLTGIPTVAGWAHELVYRDWDAYYARVDDVRTIYRGTPEQRIDRLKKYDVRYIWVGPDEKSRYDVWEFSLLDGVSVAYQNEAVTIYAVQQRSLGYSPDPIGKVTYNASEFGVNHDVATHRDGRIVANGTSANRTLAWWGPYLTHPPGEYIATFRVSVNRTSTVSAPENPALVLDVARGAAQNGTADFRVLTNVTVNETDGVQMISVPFTLRQPVIDLEFRGTLVDGSSRVSVHDVTIREITGTETVNASYAVQDSPLP